jgi:F-type H+-transporting ATPase subunit b
MDFSHALHLPKGLDDPTFWVFVALVLFLAFVTWRGVWGMITKALDERAAKIAAELEDAKRMREEAQELLASYQRRQAEAEKEAEAIVAQARKEADRLAEEMRARLADQLKRRADMAERKIAQAEADAEAMVRGQAADLAVAAARTLLADTLDEDAHAKLFDAGLADLDKRFS